MIYPKYGQLFKEIRKKHKYTLNDISNNIVSQATLSKFERGETSITIEKFVSALYTMEISLEEFELYMNKHSSNEWEILLENITDAIICGDEKRLRAYYNQALSMDLQYTALAAKCAWTSLTQEESEDITTFLYELSIWGTKEILVFALVLKDIQSKDIIYLTNILLRNTNYILSSLKHRNYVLICGCKASIVLSSRGYKDQSRYVLKKIEELDLTNLMALKNLHNMSLGYWEYCFEDGITGLSKIQRGIEICDELSTKEVASYYRNSFKKLLKKRGYNDVYDI